MRVLVTGGAGYIGSITATHLLELGHELHVLDDLSTGHRTAIPPAASFFEGRLQDSAILRRALQGCDAVVHFAARSLVAESMEKPQLYFDENVGGTRDLIEAMRACAVDRIVFSSSAAVYGQPEVEWIDEDTPLAPINPYGQSKAQMEQLLAEAAARDNFGAIALRYFNAAGAHGDLGEDHRPESHLIPRMLGHALGNVPDFVVHGSDYPTADGTAVRDYVHVHDLARAHALALQALRPSEFSALNLGSGRGQSVREILQAAATVTGKSFDVSSGPRRPGDPPRLVASNARARERLGWQPERSDATTILADAWAWHRRFPDGYPD